MIIDKDKELIAQWIDKDPELRKYYEEHQRLEEQIEEFVRRPYLTTEEEIEKKRLQKMKLAVKDKILEILEKYRKVGG
ncbi:hypothetical protein HNQ76_001287 [Thermosulfuriphilus ammonigenes]|uniref:YdcH family protein n=1 Tax=Thermosulfuriphilus ammonigenes TaxID=1936021 RepID=UPI00183BD705|nr:YdcH family protein [Thermosulfuriphilus ammonigenes]MBA2848903.1 hypothetical protein [Thermosulfuriphilus ammonigenes]